MRVVLSDSVSSTKQDQTPHHFVNGELGLISQRQHEQRQKKQQHSIGTRSTHGYKQGIQL